MTETELKAIEAWVAGGGKLTKRDVRALVAEVRRLWEVDRRHDALYAHVADVHAALGEWDDKEFTAAGSVRRLVLNLERLRGIIMMGEHRGQYCDWCGLWRKPSAKDKDKHSPDCPAFTPDGDVR